MARNQQLNIKQIKQQFPALARLSASGLPFIHADAPGGTQVPLSVIEAISRHLYSGTANASLSGHFTTCLETTELLFQARRAAAIFLNALPEHIVFGANMTSLTFTFSRAISQTWKPGSEILISALDHDANIAPWLFAARERDCSVKMIPVDEQGQLILSELDSLLTQKTAMVAFSLASNAIGTITDVHQIIQKAQSVGALTYVDAVHYAAHKLIDMQTLGCDFLVCSPYKFFGPHIGILCSKSEHLNTIQPYKVRPASESSPQCWETGTQSFEALAGTLACIQYLASLSGDIYDRQAIVQTMTLIEQHEQRLSQYFLAEIRKVSGITLYGLTESAYRTSTFGLTLDNLPPSEVAKMLAGQNIFCWSGNFYAQELMRSLNLDDKEGMLRIGFVHYHDQQDVSKVLEALDRIAAMK